MPSRAVGTHIDRFFRRTNQTPHIYPVRFIISPGWPAVSKVEQAVWKLSVLTVTPRIDKISVMKEALIKTYKTFQTALPIILGVFLLISLINSFSNDIYGKIFTGNIIFDPIIGALAGAFSFGIPIASFVAAGELLKEGVSLLAITAFLITWTTVSTAMSPLEVAYIGKRFTIVRNIVNLFLAVIAAILIVLTFKAFS